ncbi:hypothetical protein NM688_g29 [Phlebia brevispora]|uniref:Uncharacterized protein n=1 Tax=Phlebia brevispora TaxID=194682 RepID=A0ACC1TFU5_9APHY|nr:hypothetical protein NM688_g29 [Phlebia brevispora]
MDDIMDAVHAVRHNVGSRIAKALSPSSRRQLSGPSTQGAKLQSKTVVSNTGRAPPLQVFDCAEVRRKSNTSFWDAPSGLGETKGKAEQQTMDLQVEDLCGIKASSLPSGSEPCTHDVKKVEKTSSGEKKPRMATGLCFSLLVLCKRHIMEDHLHNLLSGVDQYKNFLVAVCVFGVLTLHKRLGKEADMPIQLGKQDLQPSGEKFKGPGLNRKAKRSDPDDIALTDGAMYFTPAATIKKDSESSETAKARALDMQQVQSNGYAYVDLAQACALQEYMALYMQVSAYDINYQHRKNLAQWMKELNEIAQKLEIRDFKMTYFPRTTAEVGKFHLPSHKQEWAVEEAIDLQEMKAQILFELGLGEASDVSEADMTERCDAFFKRADDWHEKAGIYLTLLVDEAVKSMNASALIVAVQALLMECTEAQIDEEVEDWQEDDDSNLPASKPQEDSNSPAAMIEPAPPKPAKKKCGRPQKARLEAAPRMLHTPFIISGYLSGEGSAQESTKCKRDEGTTSNCEHRRKMRNEWWKEVNSMLIELPSSYDACICRHHAMAAAVMIERQVLKGYALEVLDELRSLLVVSASLKNAAQQHQNQEVSTRICTAQRHRWRVIQYASSTYRCMRKTLMSLGMDKNDTQFRELTWLNVHAFVVLPSNQQLEDSWKHVSWIWKNLDFAARQKGEVVEYCINGTSGELYASFSNCDDVSSILLLLLRAEMRRTIHYFKFYEMNWTEHAAAAEAIQDNARMAYAWKLLEGCEDHFTGKEGINVVVLCEEVVERKRAVVRKYQFKYTTQHLQTYVVFSSCLAPFLEPNPDERK